MIIITYVVPRDALQGALLMYINSNVSLYIKTPPGIGTVFTIQQRMPRMVRITIDSSDIDQVHDTLLNALAGIDRKNRDEGLLIDLQLLSMPADFSTMLHEVMRQHRTILVTRG